MPDSISRFLFEHTDIRGEIVALEHSFAEVLGKHHYPTSVEPLLGEFIAAAVLLSATIKLNQSLTLQAKGSGDIGLIMAECGSDMTVRAIAGECRGVTGSDFRQLLGSGTLAITITPASGQRYQGVVSLDNASLAGCIEHYFAQSEQLPTRLFLAADRYRAAGLLIQALPPQQVISREQRQHNFAHIEQLAATISTTELLALPPAQVLHRLFHAESVRLSPARPVTFGCSCSAERIVRALLVIGAAEARSVLDEQGVIAMNCEFCGSSYRFTGSDVDALFGNSPPPQRH